MSFATQTEAKQLELFVGDIPLSPLLPSCRPLAKMWPDAPWHWPRLSQSLQCQRPQLQYLLTGTNGIIIMTALRGGKAGVLRVSMAEFSKRLRGTQGHGGLMEPLKALGFRVEADTRACRGPGCHGPVWRPSLQLLSTSRVVVIR